MVIMKLVASSIIVVFVVIELSICLAYNEEDYRNNTITDYTLRQLLEKFKQMFSTSQAIPDQQIFINQTQVFLNGTITSSYVSDLTSFNTDLAHVNMSTLEFFIGISYNVLSISGSYTLYFDNNYVHMDSADQYSIDISDLASSVYIKLSLKEDQTLQVEKFTLDYNMTIKVDIKYLGGNSEVSNVLNKLINDNMPDVIDSTKPDVQGIVSGIVLERSTFIIGGMTLQKFIDLINNIVNS